MSDTRPAETPNEALARMQKELDDLKSTLLTRVARRPTGTPDVTLLDTPPADALILNGQTISKTTYAALWKWVTDNSRLGKGFTDLGGDNFSIPNTQGRVLMGAGSLSPDTYSVGQTLGSARHTLTTTEMPSHSHSSQSAGGHSHDIFSSGHNHSLPVDFNGTGTHGHNGAAGRVAEGPSNGSPGADATTDSNGSHDHGISTDGSHSHTINSTGGSGSHENRQPSIVVNFMIWA